MSNIAPNKKEQFLFDFHEEEMTSKKTENVIDVPYIKGDLDNIKEMLSELYDSQQEDVLRIEERFRVGKGYLCTNGTGTGKTFVGLGTVKRFCAKGCRNILIITPTETKCLDWIEEAKHLNLNLYMLQSIEDSGFDIRVTTYANFYQNETLDNVVWDLIIYDESHYLNQNSKGQATSYLQKHKVVSNLPSAVKEKAYDIIGDRPVYNPAKDDYELYHWQFDAWKNQMKTFTYDTVVKTKVLFLSATPFAYHKSILYADGALFDIEETIEKEEPSGRYNEASGFNKFLTEHFGYRMRYNKCTIPETGVDQSLLERNFFETHVEKGIMSTRILELKHDYSREFVLVSSNLGNFINSGIEMWYNKYVYEKYKYMERLIIKKKYNYIYVNQLLEAIKAKEILDRIQQHLDLGRKVVVFHSYNHSTVEHPFRFDADKLTKKDDKGYVQPLKREINEWYSEYPEYANLSLEGLNNCRATIKERFPDMLEFNGTISKKKKKKNKELFNDDNSGYDLIVIQSKAGKEGISLHDNQDGKPRVLINLSLPVAPTEAIQTEGRIYRSGLKSNAMFEYPVIHTNFEKIAFATKIAERAKTAENLAMGNLARDLETAFKEGYVNVTMDKPNLQQGVGGKENDRALIGISDFDKAKTYYFSRGKKNAKNKSAEGKDYFATPEPLGYKMVQWLDPQPDEDGLEPSVGHGAIGRWFPGTTSNVYVEPSLELFSQMTINCVGRHENMEFEELPLVNKFDFIAMNPPFGKNSRQAAEHIQKALLHMRQRSRKGARLLAIVPNGASMSNNLIKLMEHKKFANFRLTGEMLLPAVTFNRAGTGVMCKIIRIEHVNTGNDYCREIDLTHCKDIGEFFDEIEHIDF